MISKEADKLRKNLEKLINEQNQLKKTYQIKLNKGLMIIKTILILNSSKNKNKKKDSSELQIFLRCDYHLPIPSPKINNNNNFKNYFKKEANNNQLNYYNLEDIFNKNIIASIEETINITQKVSKLSSWETFNNEITTCKNFIQDKRTRYKNRNKFEKSYLRDLCLSQNRIGNKIKKEIENNFKFNICKFKIIRVIDYQFLNKKKKFFDANKNKKYFYLGNRKFTFPEKFINISCFEIYITKTFKILIPKQFKRVYVKLFLILIIYLVISFYLMILIQNIQNKYGKNFIQLCILPFFSAIFIEYFISLNIMMFITTIILFHFGEYFINNKKAPFYLSAISKIFISPQVINHYNAIKLYLLLK